jgi:hypothetical protein
MRRKTMRRIVTQSFVSGNGYAFLLLYRLVNDPILLQRAKTFAIIMMDQKFEVTRIQKLCH